MRFCPQGEEERDIQTCEICFMRPDSQWNVLSLGLIYVSFYLKRKRVSSFLFYFIFTVFSLMWVFWRDMMRNSAYFWKCGSFGSAIKILFSLFTLRMVICPRSSDNDTISEFANLISFACNSVVMILRAILYFVFFMR